MTASTIVELASYSTISVSTLVLPPGYSTWPRALWNDVMVKEGISMETPTIMGSIEISRTRPYSSKIKM